MTTLKDWSFEWAAKALGVEIVSQPKGGVDPSFIAVDGIHAFGGESWGNKVWISQNEITQAVGYLTAGPNGQTKVQAHELAHHVLGHTKVDPATLSRQEVDAMEALAEVVARRVMQLLGDDKYIEPIPPSLVADVEPAAQKIVQAGGPV